MHLQWQTVITLQLSFSAIKYLTKLVLLKALSDTQSYRIFLQRMDIRRIYKRSFRYNVPLHDNRMAAIRPRALVVMFHGKLMSMYESLPCAVRTMRGLCALCLFFALDYTTYGYETIQTQIYIVWIYDNRTKRCSNHRFDIRRIFIRRINIQAFRHIKASYSHMSYIQTRTL